MSDASVARIGDFVSLQRGTTYKSRLLGKPGPVLLGLASIQRNGGFRSDSLRTYGGESNEKLLLNPGDLYVSLKDVTQSADLLGAVARVPSSVKVGRLTQDTVKLIFDKDEVPCDYIYWLLHTPQYREYCRSNAIGTTNLSLTREDFLSFPVPPLTRERAELVEALGKLGDKIAVNERIAATVSELAAVLFLTLDERTAVTISDVANVTMGQSPSGETYNGQSEGLPFYQGTRDFGFRYPGRRVWCTAVTRRAHDGDILVSVRAPVGQINVAAEECGIGRGLAVVRAKKYPHVMFQALAADSSVWLPYEAEGTVFGSINKKQLSQLIISWPNPDRIDELEGHLALLDDRLRRGVEESATLATLRDTLLPQLMSGKLRVRDAERIVEDAV